ncbi:hypothetical protein B0H12DRAFT_1146405 [Mycena haematopus]|nr:hypothetical protein B0H12DRAFT_1146405 [Mycena haematopus]
MSTVDGLPPQYEQGEYHSEYDPAESLAALRIDDQREPVPRQPRNPRHANTLPARPNQHQQHSPVPQNYPQNYPPNGQRDPQQYPQEQYYQDQNYPQVQNYPQDQNYPQQPYDVQSVHSQSTYDTAYETYNSPGGYNPPGAYNPQQYNPLYAAASNVLGMGPLLPGLHLLSHSAPYPASTHSGNTSYAPPSSLYTSESSELELRPPLNRADPTFSAAPSSVKSKAVDLSAPPYTKEYIDQYRQRIKADPDPESHYLYAKYLVDAAKNIRQTAKDQRSAKKYTELLITEALKVVRRLATQGEAYDEAQFYLANCYGTGALGLPVDHERAYHLYLQAAKQNHAAASYRVAVCNEIGAGTRREPSRAASFYRKAASLGDTPAMYKLGMILLHGSLGEQKNPREAINWLRRAAEQADEDNPHALHELGLLHEIGEHVPQDHLASKNLFTRAAHLGYTQSQFKLGQCYEYGALTCPMDPRRSIAWYTKAAEKGDSEAELALSGWYLTGSEGVLKQSDSEAYLWARRAANKGLSKAEYAVGYYAEVGIGIKQDVEFAKRWYMRAAAQGNKRAMNRLTEMKRMGSKRGPASARPTRQQAQDNCIIA